jgi:hypothetical protein
MSDIGQREVTRRVSWSVLVALAAGALAGAIVGGVGGRLAMLLLRLTSPESVTGMTTDDGFEIGVFTADTLNLVAGMTMFGGVNGALYAMLRRGIPSRLRLPLWTMFGAVLGGATIVHDDGVDFTVLEPLLLAIALFVLLPGLASAVVVILVEHWEKCPPFASRRQTIVLAVCAVAGTFALVPAALAFLVLLVIERIDGDRVASRLATLAVTGALVVVCAVSVIDLVGTSRRIL